MELATRGRPASAPAATPADGPNDHPSIKAAWITRGGALRAAAITGSVALAVAFVTTGMKSDGGSPPPVPQVQQVTNNINVPSTAPAEQTGSPTPPPYWTCDSELREALQAKDAVKRASMKERVGAQAEWLKQASGAETACRGVNQMNFEAAQREVRDATAALEGR